MHYRHKEGLLYCVGEWFLWAWHVYRGRDDPLRGKDYVYNLIYNTLLADAKWDNRGCVMFCDANFTSTKLFRDLWNNRGIGAVGPINAYKPIKRGGPTSWTIQNFKKSDVRYLSRGWDKAAFTPLHRGGCMQALTWLDNKFVKLLTLLTSPTRRRWGPGKCIHTHAYLHP